MPAGSTNPLLDDRDVELILDELLDIRRLLRLPHFADHDRETCELLLGATRALAREVLYPAYRVLDADPPRLVDGRVRVHPRMRELYARMFDLGLVAATRPHEVGGRRCRSPCSRWRAHT
jgi:butyryl-CoA dehydrogenase